MAKSRNWLTLVIGLCLLVMLVSAFACGGGTQPTTTSTASQPTTNSVTTQTNYTFDGPDINIGGAIPLTGQSSSGGADLFFGYTQGVNDINAAGGIVINGKRSKIVLKLLDDTSDATQTVSRLEQLNSVNHVVAYLGSYSSDLNGPAAAIAEKNKIPMVAVAFSNLSPHQQGYKYLFSPFVKSPQGVDSIFQLLNTLGSKKPTKIALWSEQSDWGTEIAKIVPQDAQKYGYQMVENDFYDTTAVDFSSFITTAKTDGAQVLISIPIPATAITMGKQMKELDFNPLASVLWRGAGAASWPKTMGTDGNYAMYVANWDWHYNTPGTKELVENYRALASAMPSVNVGSGYGAIQVLADAINRAQSLDPSKIRDALAATKNLQTILGTISSFDSTGVAIMPSSIMQWQNMISQVVWPDDFASAKFMYPTPAWNAR